MDVQFIMIITICEGNLDFLLILAKSGNWDQNRHCKVGESYLSFGGWSIPPLPKGKMRALFLKNRPIANIKTKEINKKSGQY